MFKPQWFRLCLFLWLPAAAFAQLNPSLASPLQETSALAQLPAPEHGEGRIKLDVVVTDKAGRPVSGLEARDFTLLDNSQPAKILSFQAVDGIVQKAHPPVEVIILIDTVNLTIQSVLDTREQIENLLRRNGGQLDQPISIFFLTNQGLELQRQSSFDGNALAAQVEKLDNRLRTIGAAANTYKAVESTNGPIERFGLSIQALKAIGNSESKKAGRKLLIWAGPGWPMLDSQWFETSSKAQKQYFDSIVELSTKIREARIDMYSISLGAPSPGIFHYQGFLKGVKSADKATASNLDLKVLVTQSGGRVLGPTNDLAGQINSCIEDAGAFYSISFDPPPAAQQNEYHDLKVQIGKPGLTARTSSGYYNQP